MASERGRALQERQTNHFVSSSNRRSVSRNRLANTGIFLSASSTSEAPGTKGANSLYTAMTSATATIPLFSLPLHTKHTHQTNSHTNAGTQPHTNKHTCQIARRSSPWTCPSHRTTEKSCKWRRSPRRNARSRSCGHPCATKQGDNRRSESSCASCMTSAKHDSRNRMWFQWTKSREWFSPCPISRIRLWSQYHKCEQQPRK